MHIPVALGRKQAPTWKQRAQPRGAFVARPSPVMLARRGWPGEGGAPSVTVVTVTPLRSAGARPSRGLDVRQRRALGERCGRTLLPWFIFRIVYNFESSPQTELLPPPPQTQPCRRCFACIVSFPRWFWKEQLLFVPTVNMASSSATGNLGGRGEHTQASERRGETGAGDVLCLPQSSNAVCVCHSACIFNMILVTSCVHGFRYYFFALKPVTFPKALEML